MLDRDLFRYTLPREKIAQRPAGFYQSRAGSRLLRVQRLSQGVVTCSDVAFSELPKILRPGDLLVLNNTRVIPSRFFVKVNKGAGALCEPSQDLAKKERVETEVLLVQRQKTSVDGRTECWEALARPMRRLRAGTGFSLSEHLRAFVLGRTKDGTRLVLELKAKGNSKTVSALLETEGSMPIPPYIRSGRSDNLDRDLYQTVYAQTPGSVAAPTAGLHFTKELLEELEKRAVEHLFVTLHVGPASFLPVREDDISAHKMLSEQYEIEPSVHAEILKAKREGRRIVAVGTTTVRALESAALRDEWTRGEALERAKTELFITPGFEFRVVDVLITNYHQPGSTHLLMVAAFIGEDAAKKAYDHALRENYRFLSYGDSMILERKQGA